MTVNIWDQRSMCKPLCSTDPPTQPTQRTPAPAAHRYCPFVMSKKRDSQLLLKAESCCSGRGAVFWLLWYPGPAGPLSQGAVWGRAPLEQGDTPGCGAGVGEAERRHLGRLAKYKLKVSNCSISSGDGCGCQGSPGRGATGLRLACLRLL